MKRSLIALLILSVLVGFGAPAHAGQLFPPSNIGANPNVACPNGEVLTWTGGSVACADPTAGVTLTCQSGQYLAGISHGQPVCVDLPASDAITATCPAGQTLTGINAGQPICETSSGISATTATSCRTGAGSYSGGNYQCTTACPAGYHRTACTINIVQQGTITGPSVNTSGAATPSGTDACQCAATYVGSTCYAYCAK